MNNSESLVLWYGGTNNSDLMKLFDSQEILCILVDALLDYSKVSQPDTAQQPACVSAMIADFAPLQHQFEISQEFVSDLLNCIAWSPGHPYHMTFCPAMPAILGFRASLETLFDRWRNQLDSLQSHVEKLEAAAIAYERGEAVLDADGKVVRLAVPDAMQSSPAA